MVLANCEIRAGRRIGLCSSIDLLILVCDYNRDSNRKGSNSKANSNHNLARDE